MRNEHYQRIITEWCQTTGMPAWSPLEDQHLEINDTLVGLIPGTADEPDALHIYIDLGRYDVADIYPNLLEANLPLDASDRGCFGLHPLTRSVVYRTLRRLDADTDAATLAQQLEALITNVRHRFDAALAH